MLFVKEEAASAFKKATARVDVQEAVQSGEQLYVVGPRGYRKRWDHAEVETHECFSFFVQTGTPHAVFLHISHQASVYVVISLSVKERE